MPETFSFEEASAPQTFSFEEAAGAGTFSFEEASVPPTAAPATEVDPELAAAAAPARMTMTRAGKPVLEGRVPVSGEPPLAGPVGSVMRGYEQPASAESLIEQRGAPVEQKIFEAVKRGLERATPAQREQTVGRDDWVGSVAKTVMAGWAKQDQMAKDVGALQGLTKRAEDRAKALVKGGMDPEVAKNEALRQIDFGDNQPPATAKESDFDFSGSKWWKEQNPFLRGGAKGMAALGSSAAGMAQFTYDILGTQSIQSAAKFKEAMDRLSEETVGDQKGPQRWLEGAVSSSVSQLIPALALGFASAPAHGLAFLGVQQFGDSYADGKKAGLTPAENTARASVIAAAEVVGELFSLPFAVKGLREMMQGVPTERLLSKVGEFMTGLLARDLPGEAFTQSVESMADKFAPFGLTPDLTSEQFYRQMVDVVMQTTIQTALMGGAGGTLSVAARVKQAAFPQRAFAQALATDIADTYFIGAQERAKEALSPENAQTAAAPAAGQAPVLRRASGIQRGAIPLEAETPEAVTVQPAGTEAPSAPYTTPEALYDWEQGTPAALPAQRPAAIGAAATPEAQPAAGLPTEAPTGLEMPVVPEGERWDGKVVSPGGELAEPFPDLKPPKVTSLLQRIKKMGGVDPSYAPDITGESKMGMQGVPPGFFATGDWKLTKAGKQGKGWGLDDIATALRDEGWNIPDDPVDGGVAALTDMIRDEIFGNKHYSFSDTERIQAYEMDLRRRQEAQDLADQAGAPDWVPEMDIESVNGFADATGYEATGDLLTLADMTERANAVNPDATERAAIQLIDAPRAEYVRELWRIINEGKSGTQVASGSAVVGEGALAAQGREGQAAEAGPATAGETGARSGERGAGDEVRYAVARQPLPENVRALRDVWRELERKGAPEDQVRKAFQSYRQALRASGVAPRYATAYHGTPHIWPPEPGFPHGRPRLDKIGTGEGAQAYGWGWYSAENDAVADSYGGTNIPGSRPTVMLSTGEKFEYGTPENTALIGFHSVAAARSRYTELAREFAGSESATAFKEHLKAIENIPDADATLSTGSLYRLDIPDDVIPKLLNWDKPLSEQTKEVRDAFKKTGFTFSEPIWTNGQDREPTGAEIYNTMAIAGKAVATSQKLASIGIPGNKYLDQGSRGKEGGTYNYVLWDQKVLDRVALLERNGEKLDAMRGEAKFSKQDQTQTPEFKAWFGDSKVVDAKGKPLVVYHGTPDPSFNKFALKGGMTGELGFWFTSNADATAPFRRDRYANQGAATLPVFLTLKNPMVYDGWKSLVDAVNAERRGRSIEEGSKSLRRKLMRAGYDGIINRGTDTDSGILRDDFVAFHPEQIKSAIGNTGAFSPTDPDIRRSVGDIAQTIQQSSRVSTFVGNLFKSPSPLGPLNWINTPFHKAQKLAEKGMPGYKRVFERMQHYLNDISGFAIKSEQLMPSIMRELKGIMPKDFKEYFKSAASEKDIATIGPWLNHGTLYGGGNPLQGVVWTDDELRGKFGLNRNPGVTPLTEAQIPLYRQARAGIDQSLETSAKAVIYHHVVKYGIIFDRDMSLADVSQVVRDKLDERIADKQLAVDHAIEEADTTFVQFEAKTSAAKSDRQNREARIAADNAKAAYDKAQTHLNRLQGELDAMKAMAGDSDAEIRRKEANNAQVLQASPKEDIDYGTIRGIERHGQALIDHGYMPLKRFGNKTVTAIDDEGRIRFFGAYDGTPLVPGSANEEMHRVAAEVKALHPEWKVVMGTKSERAWKMYQGLSLDALENFLDFLDPETKAELERDKTIQEYLRNAVSDRSVLKQLIHRKGTPGFSTDVPRILASFVTQSARNASGLYHIADAKRLVSEMTPANGEEGAVQDEAADLVDFVTKPGEDFAKLRSFLFFNFLGGSVASAAINLTQSVMITAPYLSKYTGIGALTSAIGRAAKLAVGDPAKMAGQVGTDLQRAELDGVTAPQQIYHLTAMASNNPFSSDRRFRTAMAAWNGMFGAAEVFNRRVAFLAAHDIFTSMTPAGRDATGFTTAYDFAKDTVDQTQFIYNKGNRPNAGRTPVGAVILTFKTFSISYLELLSRLPPQQQLMMLGVLLLAAGAEGLPFAEDIEDAVDTLGQWLGFTTNTGKWTGKTIRDTLGSEYERPILKGLGGMLPQDLHSRLGMPNLLPGTSFFKPSEIDKTRDVAEAVGPVGSVMKSMMDALQLLARGKWDRAAVQAAPKAMRDWYNGIYMGFAEETQDVQGRLGMKDVTMGEAAGKFIGFNPQRSAIESEAKREEMLDKNLRTVRMDDIASDWADGILRDDQSKVRDAIDRLVEWNQDNPEMYIDRATIFRSVRGRVIAGRMTSAQRFEKSMPKAMKAETREVLNR